MMSKPNAERAYIAIDLKSFYASVECVERGLNPLDTHLVVADESRTTKTICLAVSPTLKAYGISGRARLFEAVRRVNEVNRERRARPQWRGFVGKSSKASEVDTNLDMELDFIIAPPRMALYIDYSTRVYKTYLRYIAPEDIHVYSIDEVFIDATSYLRTYKMSPHELARTIIKAVLDETGVTATAGIGTNMYLAKVAMDIVAKKLPPDSDGVRIAQLDEMTYRRNLWDHRPLTDFWRIGGGIAKRLALINIQTMGEIARLSLNHEDLLYQMFGVNAELLIDHAWGWEPCTIDMVKAYRPSTHSICSGQVLTAPYTADKALVVVKEMAQGVALELLSKSLVTKHITLDIGYDVDNLNDPSRMSHYHGEVVTDRFGRRKPKSVHGSYTFDTPTFAASTLTDGAADIFGRIVNPALLIRRVTLTALNLVNESTIPTETPEGTQMDLFTDYEAVARRQRRQRRVIEKERRLMQATINLKNRFGKNAILKGLNFQDGATARDRNRQIGGHKA